MYYIDSHCHINDKAYKDDLNRVLLNMKTNNVLEAMIISSFLDDYDLAKKINDDSIKFKRSLGIYPGDVDIIDNEEAYYKLFEEVDAIGEIGLDYHYSNTNKSKQLSIFEKQCALAQKLNKPIIVHSRDAIQDTYDILKKYRCKGVLHCYSSSKEMALEFVKLGYYISLSGTLTFKNAKEPLEVLKAIPIDHLLSETDCPYLSPVPNRGKRNEPANVVYVVNKMAEILKMNIDDLNKQIVKNYHRLFD